MKFLTKWLFASLFLMYFSSTSLMAQCLMNHPHHKHEHGEEDEQANQNDEITSNIESDEEMCYIAINMHFIADDFGNGNFTPYDDGHGNTANSGYHRAEQLVNYMNYMLANNQPMQIGPVAGQTPPTINWRFVLKGVYFHNNSNYMFDNIWQFHPNWGMHNDYGVDETNVINIYSMKGDNDCDANGFPYLRGIANGLGTFPAFSKTANDWRYYSQVIANNPNSAQAYNETARNILHELGHNFGLRHAWGWDGCNDTPTHPNHYCNSAGNNGSNNIMDYNCFKPAAFSPCQVGKMSSTLNNQLSSYIVQCGCEPTSAFFSMPTTLNTGTFTGTWLRGTASWKETNYQLEIFSVTQAGSTTPANPADVYVGSFNGTIGNINLKSIYSFVSNKTYLVRLTTFNDCNSDEMTQYIDALGPKSEPGGEPSTGRIANSSTTANDMTEITKSSSIQDEVMGMEIAPNPAKKMVNLSYETFAANASQIDLKIVSMSGKEMFHVVANDITELPNQVSLENFTNGLYIVILQNGQQRITKKLVVID
jgi:hypothetical protein